MKLLTWNLNCAWRGNRTLSDEMWQTVEVLDPDVALLQEAAPLPAGRAVRQWVERARNEDGDPHFNVIYARRGRLDPVNLGDEFAAVLEGQVVAAHYTSPAGTRIFLAGVHCKTGRIDPARLARLSDAARRRLPQDREVWHVDVVLEALSAFTAAGPFVVGGDFNIASRLDSIHGPDSSEYWGSSVWFDQAFVMGWRRCHLKFHAGEQQTFFRSDQMYQLDHFFADPVTYRRATSCEVVELPDRELFSDHAPVDLALGES